MSKKQIGVVVVTTAKNVTKHFETARWFSQIRVEPGNYPVFVAHHYGTAHYWVEYHGEIIADDFTPLFCGNAIGQSNTHVGEQGHVSESITKRYADELIGICSQCDKVASYQAEADAHGVRVLDCPFPCSACPHAS